MGIKCKKSAPTKRRPAPDDKRRAAAAHIASILKDLQAFSAKADYCLLAYFLNVAQIEAEFRAMVGNTMPEPYFDPATVSAVRRFSN